MKTMNVKIIIGIGQILSCKFSSVVNFPICRITPIDKPVNLAAQVEICNIRLCLVALPGLPRKGGSADERKNEVTNRINNQGMIMPLFDRNQQETT